MEPTDKSRTRSAGIRVRPVWTGHKRVLVKHEPLMTRLGPDLVRHKPVSFCSSWIWFSVETSLIKSLLSFPSSEMATWSDRNPGGKDSRQGKKGRSAIRTARRGTRQVPSPRSVSPASAHRPKLARKIRRTCRHELVSGTTLRTITPVKMFAQCVSMTVRSARTSQACEVFPKSTTDHGANVLVLVGHAITPAQWSQACALRWGVGQIPAWRNLLRHATRMAISPGHWHL